MKSGSKIRIIGLRFIIFYFFFNVTNTLNAQTLPFQTPDFKDSALENRSTLCSFVDKSGYYWFGGMGLGLTRYDGERVEYYLIPGGRTMIMNILQDKEGYLWCTANTNSKVPSGIYVSNVPVGEEIMSDTLYFTQKHKGTKLLDGVMMNGRLRINKKGTILSSNTKHVVRYSFDEENHMNCDTLYSHPQDESKSGIKDSYITDDEQYFYFVSGEKIIQHQNHGLENERLSEIKVEGVTRGRFSDYQENKLWFSDADNGILSIDLENKQNLERIDIPNGADFLVLLENNKVLTSNDRGLKLIDLKKPTQIQSIGVKEGLTNSKIWQLSKNDKEIMVNSNGEFTTLPLHFQALELYEPETNVDGKKFINEKNISRLYEDIIFPDKKSYVALCTTNGLTLINEEGKHQLLNQKDGLLHQRSLAIRSDDQNRVWLLENKSRVVCIYPCLLYTSPSPRDATLSRMPSSA